MLEWYRADAGVDRRSPTTPRRSCGSARAPSTSCAPVAARSSRRGRGCRSARRASAGGACASTATRTPRRCARASRPPAGACPTTATGATSSSASSSTPSSRTSGRTSRRWSTTGRARCARWRATSRATRASSSASRSTRPGSSCATRSASSPMSSSSGGGSRADLAERRRRGLPEYPIDEKFLTALGEMPPSAGIALGVDRLAMLLLGASLDPRRAAVRRRRALEVVRAAVGVVGDVTAVGVARRAAHPASGHAVVTAARIRVP